MAVLSVLLTNNALAVRGGSETYVRDVAIALQRRGHRPTVFSLVHGEMAADLRRATVPVIDRVTQLGEPPDIIHGHHHLETLIAALAFPDTPVVNFCHGWAPWEEMPLHHPSVRRYVAVDETCLDRLVREEGLPLNQVELLLNFVDLERFLPRRPLPERPARAVIMSNAATGGGYVEPIRLACEHADIALDVVGASAGNATSAPESLLAQYDLVFAKGRTALDALAVGCATVLADRAGAGPLVTPDNYEVLRVRNFGIRELRQRHDVDWYRSQICRYDPQGAAQVSARVRAEAALEPAITRLLAIYSAAIEAPPGPGEASLAAAIHCSRLALQLKQAYWLADQHTRDAEREHLSTSHALQTRIDELLTDAVDQKQATSEAELQSAAAREHVRALQSQIAAFRALPTLRLRDAVLRTPFGSTVQTLVRGLAQRLR